MRSPYLLVDAHEDLAWNMLTFGRDYARTCREIRASEAGTAVPDLNGDSLIGWDVYQQGRIAVVFATLYASPERYCEGEWDVLCYGDNDGAYALYRQQMDAYTQLVDQQPDRFRLLLSQADLRAHLKTWDHLNDLEPPVGLVILMEGADAVRHVDELSEWWQRGVRLIGPAWAGTRYCGGSKEPGPLTKAGYQLLDAMADLGFILDISHMDEPAALQAIGHFSGRLIASHTNPLAMLPGEESNRFLSDQALKELFDRDGVVGVVPYNRFLDTNWRKGMRRELVSLERVVPIIDHVCQLAGDALHVAFGSDADGGFGWQAVPAEMDTLADLQKLAPMLAEKGYRDEDIAAIFGDNWLGVLHSALPEQV